MCSFHRYLQLLCDHLTLPASLAALALQRREFMVCPIIAYALLTELILRPAVEDGMSFRRTDPSASMAMQVRMLL